LILYIIVEGGRANSVAHIKMGSCGGVRNVSRCYVLADGFTSGVAVNSWFLLFSCLSLWCSLAAAKLALHTVYGIPMMQDDQPNLEMT